MDTAYVTMLMALTGQNSVVMKSGLFIKHSKDTIPPKQDILKTIHYY